MRAQGTPGVHLLGGVQGVTLAVPDHGPERHLAGLRLAQHGFGLLQNVQRWQQFVIFKVLADLFHQLLEGAQIEIMHRILHRRQICLLVLQDEIAQRIFIACLGLLQSLFRLRLILQTVVTPALHVQRARLPVRTGIRVLQAAGEIRQCRRIILLVKIPHATQVIQACRRFCTLQEVVEHRDIMFIRHTMQLPAVGLIRLDAHVHRALRRRHETVIVKTARHRQTTYFAVAHGHRHRFQRATIVLRASQFAQRRRAQCAWHMLQRIAAAPYRRCGHGWRDMVRRNFIQAGAFLALFKQSQQPGFIPKTGPDFFRCVVAEFLFIATHAPAVAIMFSHQLPPFIALAIQLAGMLVKCRRDQRHRNFTHGF